MRIQLIFFMIFYTLNAFSADDKSMNELFKKYDLVLEAHKVEYLEEIFSKRYIKENGGSEAYKKKIKLAPKYDEKNIEKPKVSWSKTTAKEEQYFVKLDYPVDPKEKKQAPNRTKYIVIKEDGKLKIDGYFNSEE